jgi:hypothetical protein
VGDFHTNGRDWLAICRRQVEATLPEPIVKDIPEDLWKVYPMGRHIVVRRFPRTTQYGAIHIQETAQTPTWAGWVLSANPSISGPSAGPSHGWEGEPLDLVGQVVVLFAHRGNTLRLSMTQREYMGDYIQVHIGDVMAVMFDVPDDYWSPVKPVNLVRG